LAVFVQHHDVDGEAHGAAPELPRWINAHHVGVRAIPVKNFLRPAIRSPFQAILKELGKDVQIWFS
jgi:hypothetical protein